MKWDIPKKPAELAEQRLITAILDGHFAIGAKVPPERELAAQLGVTRPTLREALQRLARDGWLEIRHGRSTRVRNYWQEGRLGVLSALAEHPQYAPEDFIPNLLTIRQLMAPTYTRLAITQDAPAIVALLKSVANLEDAPAAFAAADWQLHHRLTVLSGNPIFTLILNGFADLYSRMALAYFAPVEARSHSRAYYTALLAAAQANDPERAAALTNRVMAESLDVWQAGLTEGQSGPGEG